LRCSDKERKFSVFDVALSFDPPSHPLPGLGLLHPFLFAGLEVGRVLFDFLDDRFLLNLSLETPERGFQIFIFVKNDKRQELSPPHLGKIMAIYTGTTPESQAGETRRGPGVPPVTGVFKGVP
jgi:hypothetical protein